MVILTLFLSAIIFWFMGWDINVGASTIACAVCGTPFRPSSLQAQYCQEGCAVAAAKISAAKYEQLRRDKKVKPKAHPAFAIKRMNLKPVIDGLKEELRLVKEAILTLERLKSVAPRRGRPPGSRNKKALFIN